MRLADFIERNMESILSEWQAFAATRLPAAASMGSLALRNHAPLILQAIAADLRMSQTSEAQLTKSLGQAPVLPGAPLTAAEAHGAVRAQVGFNISQMVSEYRALRASVLRLWSDSGLDTASVVDDIIRFSEAIDQAIAESVRHFSDEVDRARNLFLGILGHELRSPLAAILMTAQYLSQIRADTNVSTAARRLISSGTRMHALLDDLLDYSRTNLGAGMKIVPTSTDLADICAAVLEEAKSVDPTHRVNLQITGDVRGIWDRRRLHQVLSNLVLNALTYGSPSTPVRVEAAGSQDQVVVSVRSQGPVIPPAMLLTLFEPLRRGPAKASAGVGNGHLGLGLYISREIVKAHGGEIEARSADDETVFTVRLPRQT